MALETAIKRRKRLSMTSLIDVIFLLLFFFMLTSTFSRYGEVELLAPGAQAAGTEPVPRAFLALRSEGPMLNGVPTALSNLANALKSNEAKVVLVSLSATTTSQELVDALAVLRGVPNVRPVVLQ
ncbi:ExbD/TolR family protein [Cribrihabitans sp. XS_ASV171]